MRAIAASAGYDMPPSEQFSQPTFAQVRSIHACSVIVGICYVECECALARVCVCVSVCMCMRVCARICMCICAYVRACMYMYACLCACV